MRGIYVHIPFCVQKCPYCSFVSYCGKSDEMDEYEKRLIKEIKSMPKIEADSIYFGGGTPTFFGAERLCRILYEIKNHFEIVYGAEITAEANPGTVNKKDFAALKEAGFNRVSIGIQSLDEDEIKALGRIHTAKEAKRAVYDAADAGFHNISGDIMTAVPGQTRESLLKTLSEFVLMPLTHISAYSLSIEEGTPYGENIPKNLPDEETEREMYWLTDEFLGKHGFERYEISNFAKEGFMSRHNMKYWHGEEYIGLGAGAHSYFKGERYCNTSRLSEYMNEDIIRERVLITEEEKKKEYYMLGLRIKEGVKEIPHQNLEKMISLGLIEREKGRIRLTKRGTDLASYVMEELM